MFSTSELIVNCLNSYFVAALSNHKYCIQGLETAKFCGSIYVMHDVMSKHAYKQHFFL